MKLNKESREIARHINDWLNDYVPSQKSNSSHTLKSYRDTLSLYIDFLKYKGIVPSKLCPDCFRRANIEEWIQWLMEKRKCSPETCNNRLASLRAFLKYLADKEISLIYLSLEASAIKRKKVYTKKITGMSKRAVQALLSEPNQSSKTGRRDLTLFTLMYNTASRIDEILSLKIKDLRLEVNNPHITVVGKGLKIRTLQLLPRTVSFLKQYLKEFHGERLAGDSFVFYSKTNGLHGKMSQTSINKQLKKYAATANIKCNEVPLGLHAHQIRHAKATHWLQDGINIVQISFLLGHVNMETTMRYLDITTEDEIKALATLENENDRTLSKKWKAHAVDLSAFCGVRMIRA